MKRALVALAKKFGFAVLHDSPDPLLRDLLVTHGSLRLGGTAPLRCDDPLSRLAFDFRLRYLLRHFAIDLVVDIGANRGQFAHTVRRLGFSGDIVSFEPIAGHAEELSNLARADGRWRVHRLALGATEGTLPLNVYSASTFSSFHRVNDTGAAEFSDSTKIDHIEQVPVRPLDALWPEITGGRKRRVLIKSDTQGHEREVIAGARQALAAAHVVLAEASVVPIYEDSAGFDELRSMLARENYLLSALFPIYTRPSDFALVEMDCFFVRADANGAIT